jgi:hypothetical protein
MAPILLCMTTKRTRPTAERKQAPFSPNIFVRLTTSDTKRLERLVEMHRKQSAGIFVSKSSVLRGIIVDALDEALS